MLALDAERTEPVEALKRATNRVLDQVLQASIVVDRCHGVKDNRVEYYSHALLNDVRGVSWTELGPLVIY